LTRVAILAEGQTEMEFVKRILASHLCRNAVQATGHDLGGGVTIPKIAREMRHYCESYDLVTTLVDYYGFSKKGGWTVEQLEQQVEKEIPDYFQCKAVPYVQRHEFEAFLFSDVNAFGRLPGVTGQTVRNLNRIRARFQTPEDINDNQETAPSKRIVKEIPAYRKVVDGVDLAEEITLDKIRQECTRFHCWMTLLEDSAKDVSAAIRSYRSR